MYCMINEPNMQFQLLLKNETCETVYKDSGTNIMFNSFLFLNIFETCFPIKYKGIAKLTNE
jgi:hypothetical protein